MWSDIKVRGLTPIRTIYQLKLTCPVLKIGLYQKIGLYPIGLYPKSMDLRSERNLPRALRSGEKDKELQRVCIKLKFFNFSICFWYIFNKSTLNFLFVSSMFKPSNNLSFNIIYSFNLSSLFCSSSIIFTFSSLFILFIYSSKPEIFVYLLSEQIYIA